MEIRGELYLAGNLGFSESGRLFLYDKLIPVVKSAGYSVLNPWEHGEKIIKPILKMRDGKKKREALRLANREIGKTNENLIRRGEGIVAVLDGTDADSGTSGEVSFGYAIGKTTLGYRGDFRLSSENIAAKINIQVQYFIEASGGLITSSLDELEETLKFFEFRIR
jgi:nucleoside 2-deoxyribosyltransferase